MSIQRQLAAILFADIVDYTGQLSRNEPEGLEWRRRIEQMVKASALAHAGRLVKNLGDGLMLEFASAVDAVSCALAIQREMEALNRERAATEQVQVRIGVHSGEIVREESDIYGNAVNLAQRVQSMAPPGGICITREVYVQIRPILKLHCEPFAGVPSRPLPEQVEVYQVTPEEENTASRRRRAGSQGARAPRFRALLLGLAIGVGALGLGIGLDVWRTRDLTAAPGAGTATSLGEVIRRARPWSRIHLRPGLYDEALTLDHSVTLIGGPGVVLQGGDSGCLVVRGGTVTLRGLAMRGGTGAGRAAIDLQDGELRMENCDVTSFGPACVHAHGGRSRAALRDCSLRGVIGAGLLVQDGASGELVRTLCSACERSGVSVEGEGSRVEVRECRLLDCQRNGIRVVEGARGRAADTQISQNRYANVKVDGASRLTLERCRIEEGQASGVQAQGDSQVSLIDCRVLHNGLGSGRSAEGDPIRRVGIEAENGAVVRVKGGLIAQNRFPGVWAGRNPDWLGKAARAELDDCPLAANGGAAVEIDEGGAVVARRCGLYGNARAVLVHARGSGALDGCDLEGKLVSAPGGQLTATASGTVAGLRQKLLPAAPPGAAGSRSPHGPNGSGAVDGAAGR